MTDRLRGHSQAIQLALASDSCRVFTVGGNSGSPILPLQGVDFGYGGLFCRLARH